MHKIQSKIIKNHSKALPFGIKFIRFYDIIGKERLGDGMQRAQLESILKGDTGESDGAHIHSGVYVLKDNNPLYIWLRNNNYELVNKTRGWFYNPYELERRNPQWQEN